MSQTSRFFALAATGFGLVWAAGASAQELQWQGVDPKQAPCTGAAAEAHSGNGLASMPSCDGSFRLPVAISPAPAERAKPAKERQPLVPDYRIASTELGFEQGIAPAPGRTVKYRGADYVVAEVTAAGGGPVFSGNSRHVIAAGGDKLMVGLKEVGPDQEARAQGKAPARGQAPIDWNTSKPVHPLSGGAPI